MSKNVFLNHCDLEEISPQNQLTQHEIQMLLLQGEDNDKNDRIYAFTMDDLKAAVKLGFRYLHQNNPVGDGNPTRVFYNGKESSTGLEENGGVSHSSIYIRSYYTPPPPPH